MLACLAGCLVLSHAAASAQVRRIEITARDAVAGGQAFGPAGAYENVRGLIHGELDPKAARNRLIQDLDLAPRNARGRVEYVATFSLMKPIVTERASGVLMYSVVNRGNGAPVAGPEGHVSLVSGWQGDVAPTASNQTIKVPVARGPGDAPITGPVLARFFDLPAGTTTASIRIGSMGTAFYPPESLDTSRATLAFHRTETPRGETGGAGTVPAADWAFADCRTAPFPGTPDPSRVCVKGGFDPARIYELVYTAKDPLVLGIGLAATRDIVSFFRHASADAEGNANPVAGVVRHAIGVGAVAVWQLPQDVRSPRVQRRPVGTHRLRRRDAADRGPADADELPIRGARRRRHAVRARQRAGGLVGRATPTPRAGGLRRACSTAARPRARARRWSR